MVEGRKGKAIIGFVDLLGFSQELINTWNSSNSALDRLFAIRDELAKMKPAAFVLSGVPTSPTIDEVALFSDSLIIVSTVGKSDYMSSSLMSVTLKVDRLFEIAAASGFGIRGGIEFGEIWWDGKEAIGPAFLTAYAIETKVKTSRVVVGPAALNAFANERVMIGYANQIFYRCDDNLRAVRPSATAQQALIKLQMDNPDHAYRYEELIKNVYNDDVDLRIRPNHLYSSANSTTRLLETSALC